MREPVHSWCLTHRHRIELAEDPVTHVWVLLCRTCEQEVDDASG